MDLDGPHEDENRLSGSYDFLDIDMLNDPFERGSGIGLKPHQEPNKENVFKTQSWSKNHVSL